MTSRTYNELDAERVQDAAYRELWAQIEDGRGTVADGSRVLSEALGDEASDGWFGWLAAETDWAPSDENAGEDDEENEEVDADDEW
jgi:hypothetical protein